MSAPTGIAPDLLDTGLAADLADAALSLARLFHAGATLWCVSPRWEPHAHHVAVEFVHPVIMGKRALPALTITGPDIVAQARVSARTGDVIIAVAAGDDPAVGEIMRRAPAWGAHTLWIGSGGRPARGAADHVLWIDDPDPLAPATGRFVLLYHLLWELTHVCFEHPGLLTGPAAECADEGRLAEVVEPPGRTYGDALVRTATGEERVDVTLVAPVSAGDLVLVHAGAALSRRDLEVAP
ncbi:MAG TPA: hydrogenase assembly protein HupF [Mycobacteriales bacterium]|nr:hydrogenase assembly protein HupF [Mycobacteriales bacterium]